MTIINYTKKAFSNTLELSQNEMPIGEIKLNNWSSEIYAKLNNKSYKFVKKGFWKMGFNLFEAGRDLPIADIEFNSWRMGAKIMLDSQQYELKKMDFWNYNYAIFQGENKLINLKTTNWWWNEKGEIQFKNELNETNQLLAMIGLTAITIMRRRAAAAAA